MASSGASSMTYKRARIWRDQEILDLIKVWERKSIRHALQNIRKNPDIYTKIAVRLVKKGHSRNAQQCRTKMRDLKFLYRNARKSKAQPRVSSRKCPFYDRLHAILGEKLTSSPKQTVGSTPHTPGGRVGNSLVLGREKQDVGNNQAGPAGRLRRSSPRTAALQPSQIQKQKRAGEDGLKEQMEESKKPLERIVEFLERVEKQQEGIVECLERIKKQQEGIVERLERIEKQQEGIVECLERIEKQQEGIVERLERNLSCPRQSNSPSSPNPITSTPPGSQATGRELQSSLICNLQGLTRQKSVLAFPISRFGFPPWTFPLAPLSSLNNKRTIAG